MSNEAEIPCRYREAIGAVRPDLTGCELRAHTDGWDSFAVEANGTLFKFPQSEAASVRLIAEPKALELIRPRTRLALPRMRVHHVPTLFSEHEMVPGDQVDPETYAAFDEVTRDALARDITDFFAAAHAIEPKMARASGADTLRPWPTARALLFEVAAKAEANALAVAEALVSRHAAHGADAEVFGHFDTHGWNMGFDLTRGRLVGLYDFAGAGVGPLHRDLSYPTFVDPDLTERVLRHYNRATGRTASLARALDAHGMLRVVELAEASGNTTSHVRTMFEWHARRHELQCSVGGGDG